MKIAILGTRGIPNRYGGFEQATEHLSAGLAAKGHRVTVYCSHRHPYQQSRWKLVELVHCYDPESWLGTAGQFVYDLNCLRDARKKDFDLILFMGYTSSSVWWPLFPKNTAVVSNMDGLEWKRRKYSAPVRYFLKRAERLAVKHSHHHIADATGMRTYLLEKYRIRARYIAYGTRIREAPSDEALNQYGLTANNYCMLMARMEPENHIDTILQGFANTGLQEHFLVVGSTANRYGKQLLKKYAHDPRIIFAGAIFNQEEVHALRHFARLYFHGHSVGGTNPSLLEAMSSKALIAAHDNIFNRAVLQQDAFYFSNAAEVQNILIAQRTPYTAERMRQNNFSRIIQHFTWPKIVDEYDDFLRACCHKSKHELLRHPA